MNIIIITSQVTGHPCNLSPCAAWILLPIAILQALLVSLALEVRPPELLTYLSWSICWLSLWKAQVVSKHSGENSSLLVGFWRCYIYWQKLWGWFWTPLSAKNMLGPHYQGINARGPTDQGQAILEPNGANEFARKMRDKINSLNGVNEKSAKINSPANNACLLPSKTIVADPHCSETKFNTNFLYLTDQSCHDVSISYTYIQVIRLI